MMKNVSIEWHESGLIIGQEGINEFITIPNFLKENFYNHLLTNILCGCSFTWTDLYENQITLHYQYKNKFNCFINGCYCGDLPFILLSNESVAIPVETDGTFDYFEVYDSILMECYLLEKEEVLRLTK